MHNHWHPHPDNGLPVSGPLANGLPDLKVRQVLQLRKLTRVLSL